MREAVGREAVDDAEGVAELVVEEWPDDARRQGVAQVADLLANLVPEVRHLRGWGVAAQADEDRGLAGGREAAQEVEVRNLLEPALEPLGDLQQRVVERRAWPACHHDHGPEGELRILVASERDVRADARSDGRDHHEDDDRSLAERPGGEIESAHGGAWSRRTFWPGRRVWTPAVTTMSSGARPCATTTSATPCAPTSTLRIETVLVAGSKIQTAGPPPEEASAEAGIRIPASPPR